MSKVRLRSRCYRVSRADSSDISSQILLKHHLRSNDDKSDKKLSKLSTCKDIHQIIDNDAEVQGELNHSKLSTTTVDKSLDSNLVETSSMGSQSTSQMSSSISLESIDLCKWEDCGHDFFANACHKSGTVMADELEKHLLEHHVKSQVNSKRKYFQCLWNGCKVFKRKSLSYSWLERHVVDHTENKNRPFSCIFNCNQRFSSQPLLEKHVQVHIDALNGNNFDLSLNISNDFNSNLRQRKSILSNKRPNKHLNSYHVHRPDFIDTNCFNQIWMNNILQKINIPLDVLERFNLKCLQNQSPSETLIRLLTMEFKIMGKRIHTDCQKETLIEWIQPYNLRTHSEWIDENLLHLAESLSQRSASL